MNRGASSCIPRPQRERSWLLRGHGQSPAGAVQNGQLVAIGTLTGTVRAARGNVLGPVNQMLPLPVRATTGGTCPILHLALGSIALNLLGLRVQTNEIVRALTA